MLASVTRLRVRSLFFLPVFLPRTYFSQQQIMRAEGFLGGRLLIDAHLTFWTLTVWESERAMKQFRGSGAHGKVMRHLPAWCDEGAYAHWPLAEASIPSWPEAYEKLVKEGKLSRVNHPSADHDARRFPAPRLQPLIEQNLKPATRSASSMPRAAGF